MDKDYIYALTTPDGIVRYVGRAENIKQRYMTHIREARRAIRIVKKNGGDFFVPSPKQYWIASLLHAGQKPNVICLEECRRQDADEREDYWIMHYVQAGHYLTNTKTSAGTPTLNEDWYKFWRNRRARILEKNQRAWMHEYQK